MSTKEWTLQAKGRMALMAAHLLGTPVTHTVPGHACGPSVCINSAPFLSPSSRSDSRRAGRCPRSGRELDLLGLA